MTRDRIAVTGAAGKTGLAVVGALAAAGFEVTALVRRPEQRLAVRDAGADRAEVVDVEDAAAVASALTGHGGIYHVPPNMHPDETGIARLVIDAARTAGVRRFVLHSVLAPYLPAMPHHLRKAASEEALRGSDLEWTILQPASYTQNTLAFVPEVRATGVLRVPYATTSPFTPVDVRDVAEVAALAFSSDHVCASYELCGPERLTTDDMAAALARLLGIDVRAEPEDVEDWKARTHLPEQTRDDLASMFAYYDRHGLVGSPWTLEHLLGRPATGFESAMQRELSA